MASSWSSSPDYAGFWQRAAALVIDWLLVTVVVTPVMVLGFGIPIISAPVRFEVEILAALVQAEVLFGDGFSLGLGSGFRIQAVVGWGPLFFGFVPAGLELRYLAVHDDAPQPGIGLGQSLVFTLGYEN